MLDDDRDESDQLERPDLRVTHRPAPQQAGKSK